MIALVAVAVVAVAAILAMLESQRRHAAQIDRLLAAGAAQNHAWAKERWELNTRIQSPEVVRVAPPAPPAPVGADDDVVDEAEVDETHLVGMVAE